MMIAVYFTAGKFAAKKRLYGLIGTSLRTRDYLNSGSGKSVHGAGTKSAANDGICSVFRQNVGQGFMSNPVGADNFTRGYDTIGHLIVFKSLGAPEMLENISVIVGYGNFHVYNPPSKNSSKVKTFLMIAWKRNLSKTGKGIYVNLCEDTI